jgi:hypothetical protein
VEAWDETTMFACWALGDDERDEALAEFRAEKDEIVECMTGADLGRTEPHDVDRDRLGFELTNCSTKEGITGHMIKQTDGSWRIGHI